MKLLLLDCLLLAACLTGTAIVMACLVAGCRADARLKRSAPCRANDPYASYSAESSGGLKSVSTRGASLSKSPES